jgi:PAS domain S-box-containing protein
LFILRTRARLRRFLVLFWKARIVSLNRLITKDGKIKWVLHSSMPIIKDGKVSELVSTVRDITERKKAEVLREEYNDTLEMLVEERTR